MSTHDAVAQRARLAKLNHPERYCPHPRCLWRVVLPNVVRPCPKHQPKGGTK